MKRFLALSIFVFLLAGCSEKDDPVGPDQNPYRGDVNLNGTAYEIADIVMFSEYFTKGISVFTVDRASQESATDINADRVTLSLADFVYGVRIIVGDVNAYPAATPPTTPAPVNCRAANGRIEILDGALCGALRLVIAGDATPILLNTEMDMKWEHDGTHSWVLVYSLDGSNFTEDVLQYQGTLISIELATAQGAPVIPTLQSAPPIYPVEQNYPNPFGTGVVDTTIMFLVPQATDYTVTIQEANGVQLESIEGYAEAGVCTVHLDFSEYESGVYFYRVEVQGETITRKLLVLH